MDPEVFPCPDTIEMTANMPKTEPRLIKTHLSWDMMPDQFWSKKCKMVYVVRNPRDTCISYLNHWRVMNGYTGDLETMVDTFLDDAGPGIYLPFNQHVLGYWAKREEPNLLIISYEEMKKDLAGIIRR